MSLFRQFKAVLEKHEKQIPDAVLANTLNEKITTLRITNNDKSIKGGPIEEYETTYMKLEGVSRNIVPVPHEINPLLSELTEISVKYGYLVYCAVLDNEAVKSTLYK